MSKKTREAKRKAMSTKERRSAQKDSGLSMKEYKSGKMAPAVQQKRYEKRTEGFLSASGKKNNTFDRKDIKALEEQGARTKDIKRFASELDRSQKSGHSQSLDGYKDATKTKGDITAYNARSIGREKGKVDFGMNDVKALRTQGYNDQQIGEYLNTQTDSTFGGRAQKFKDRYTKAVSDGNGGDTGGGDTGGGNTGGGNTGGGNTGGGNTGGGSTGNDTGVVSGVNQNVDQSTTQGNNQNTIGDNNNISGNVNQGNQNNSTNVNTAKTSPFGPVRTVRDTSTTPETDAQGFLSTKIDQIVDQSTTQGDNQNTIGDNNSIFGNLNQGNQDFSVNINSASIGSGGNSEGMTNLQYGAAQKALSENTYQRNKQTFSAMGNAAGYSAAADKVSGISNRVKGLDLATDANIDYYQKAADRATMGLYGDIWNMKAPTWKAPGDLDKIETTYDKDKDDDD